MSAIRYICISFFITILFASCEKEEKPIVLPAKNDSVMHVSATMGEQYKTQVFVNIVSGKTWTAENTSWDLQFESSEDGFLITMNGGKRVLIGNTGNTEIKNLSGRVIKMRWDNSSGMKDSTVLGEWINSQTHNSRDSVYLIDRGDDCRGNEKFYQFQIKSVNDQKYILKYALPDGSSPKEVEINKDKSKEHVYFSFGQGGQVLNFEPDKNDWHFCFLRYRWIYYEFTPPLLYDVCGIHINTHKVEVAVDSTMQFDKAGIADVLPLHFSNRRDIIGFDWKVPDFSTRTVKYTCRKYVNYFIRESGSGYEMFKLRFIGFYDQQGLKGSPQFEVEHMH